MRIKDSMNTNEPDYPNTDLSRAMIEKVEQWRDEIGRVEMYWRDGLSAVELMSEELYKQRHLDVVKHLHFLKMVREMREKIEEWKRAEWAKIAPLAEGGR